MLQHIAAELTARYSRDGVVREAHAEERFELELLYFALQLLRALLRLAPQLLDLLLHRMDHLIFLRDLETKTVFGFLLRFLLNLHHTRADPFFDGEIELPHLLLQLALAPHNVRLRLLRLGELELARLQHLVELRHFALPGLHLHTQREAGLALFFLCDFLPLEDEALRQLVLERVAIAPNPGFAFAQFGFLALELGFPALEERRGQRLGQLDFRVAMRTRDRRLVRVRFAGGE